MSGISGTSKARPRLAPFCTGSGIDIGYGGDPIVPWAITLDLPKPYTSVGNHPQNLSGDCRKLPFISESLDFVYSSHLIEDFYYKEIVSILLEWERVLRPSGRIVLYQPDQQSYLEDCKRKGEGSNEHHKEQDFSLVNFKKNVLSKIKHKILMEFNEPAEGSGYSWGIVIEVKS